MLNKQDFKGWAERNKNKVLGVPCSTMSCPIAEFFLEHNGVSYVSVTSYTVFWGFDGDSMMDLPEWAVRFIRNLDKSFPSQEVTGKDVLGVLAEID